MISFKPFVLQLFLLLLFYQSPVTGQSLDEALRANNLSAFADFLQIYPGWQHLVVPGVTLYAPTDDAVAEFLAGNPEIPASNSSARLMKRNRGNGGTQFGRAKTTATRLGKRALEIVGQGLLLETGDGGIASTQVQKPSLVEGQLGRVFTGDGLLSNVLVEIGTFDVLADASGQLGTVYSVDSFFQISGGVSESISNAANEISYLSAIFTRLPGISGQISGARALTLFAPTQEAFDESGLDVETSTDEELQGFLDYHTIIDSDVLYTPSVQNASSYTTQSGKKLVATWDGGENFYINSALIVGPDRITSNGVIQIINKVLIPPSDNATTVPGPYGPLELGKDPVPPTKTPTNVPPQATNAAAIATSNQLLSDLGFIFALAGLSLF